MCWLSELFKLKRKPRERVRSHKRRRPSTGSRDVRVGTYKRRSGRS